MASLPNPAPARSYSFTSYQASNPSTPLPGAQVDANLDLTNAAVGQIISFLNVSLNADGSLNSTAVQNAYNAGTGNPGDEQNIADIPSLQYAQLSMMWSEYLSNANDSELPADSLALMGITGQHWSSRFWANQAATAVSNLTLSFEQNTAALVVVQAEVVQALGLAGGANTTALAAFQIVQQAVVQAEQANNASTAALQAVQALTERLDFVNTLFQNQFLTFMQAFAGSLPTSPSVNGGEFWSNGGEITFNPFSSAAAGFPTSPPTAGSHILWNNNGVLSVA